MAALAISKCGKFAAALIPAASRLRTFSMRQALHTLHIQTSGKGLVEIGAEVSRWLREQNVATGLLTIFCRHTSASLLIQENADPDVQTDPENSFEEIAPEDSKRYIHQSEGLDDMPAHIRSALSPTQLAIPVTSGRMVLGTWQGIYLFEHRRAPHRREVVLHLLGE
jgi:secondary thiamine-phosphate synthase enzyme